MSTHSDQMHRHDTDFDRETAIEETGPGSWTAEVSSAWNIGENPNGGYLLSPLLRALGELTAQPDPISVTTHFLRPGLGDTSAQLRAELIREGRTFSSLRGTLVQEGKTRMEMLATFGDLRGGDGSEDFGPAAPTLPNPDDCPLRSSAHQGIELPLLDRVEVRVPADYLVEEPLDTAEMAGWIRFQDGRAADSRSLALFADAFPPAIFTRLGRTGWVPTVELTVHIRRRPAAGWVRAAFSCTDLAGSQLIEDGHLWDSNGELVTRSRQVAFLRRE